MDQQNEYSQGDEQPSSLFQRVNDVFSDETKENAGTAYRKANDVREDLKGAAGAASSAAQSAASDIGVAAAELKSEAQSIIAAAV